MITTVTLNTSVDKLYLVEKLEDYTVMRVKKVSNTAGGKGLNVSKVAYLLGEKVSALGFVGGYNGSYVSSLLEARESGLDLPEFRRKLVPVLISGSFPPESIQNFWSRERRSPMRNVMSS